MLAGVVEKPGIHSVTRQFTGNAVGIVGESEEQVQVGLRDGFIRKRLAQSAGHTAAPPNVDQREFLAISPSLLPQITQEQVARAQRTLFDDRSKRFLRERRLQFFSLG